MTLIGHTNSSQFMEWQNLVITTLNHATCAQNVSKEMPENQITTDFICLTSSNFVSISHINYSDQVNSWKNLSKFWNDGPLCRNKLGLFPLLNVATYCRISNTEVCTKEMFQILANNIDNGERGIGFRNYVRYCSFTDL